MLLNSISFLFLFPVIFTLFWLVPKGKRYMVLFFANFCLMAIADVHSAMVLLGLVLFTYAAGRILAYKPFKGLLALFILCCIGILALFRVTPVRSLVVPVGLSFYLLAAIGYLVDVVRDRDCREKNFLRFGAFLAFFPTVVSGPIERSSGLLRQIKEGVDFEESRARHGLYQIALGLFEKVVVADRLAEFTDGAYAAADTGNGAVLLLGVVLYGFELYADFSGYSHLAIGVANVMGFDISPNFRQPYLGSVREFWSRWHISLSSWLKDYVYIPLGGNRKGKARKALNLMITFLVSGLWHGTGLQYLVWGALHGIYQIVAGFIPARVEKRKNLFIRVVGIVLNFIMVDFAWLFFRAGDINQGLLMVKRIFTEFRLKATLYYGTYLFGHTKAQYCAVLAGVVILILIDILHERKFSFCEFSKKIPAILRFGIYVLYGLFIVLLMVKNYGLEANSFIYAGF